MLEIIALIFLTREIGNLARRKGQAAGKWKLMMVGCWIFFEIIGLCIGLAISKNILLAMLLGIVSAVGSYFLMKYRLDRMPDLKDHWTNRIGQQ